MKIIHVFLPFSLDFIFIIVAQPHFLFNKILKKEMGEVKKHFSHFFFVLSYSGLLIIS